MRYYEQDDNRKGRRTALMAAAGYLAVLLILFFTISFRTVYNTVSDGMIVDFGSAEEGSGATEVTSAQIEEPDPVPTQLPEEVITQTHEKTVSVEEQTVQDPDPVIEPEKVEEPQVNPRGLFPGVSTSPSTSQGNTGAQTNRGHEAGAESTPDAAGKGTDGTEIDLPNRQVMGRLPLPRYNEDIEGRIIVDITVDGRGNVVRASVKMEGTTILNETLHREAVEAARRSKFSGANLPEQFGSITYVFKLK